jgi:outer membrane protein
MGITAEQIAQKEIKRQEAAQMPGIDLVASYNQNKNSNTSTTGVQSKLNQAYAGFEISLPLYTGGAAQSRVREAQANLERAQQELLNARRQARLDSRQAYLGVQSGSALHQALRQALQSSETQLRSTRRGFEVGVRTRVDVLNAEQQLYATKKDLATSRYQTLVAALQLKAAAGALTEQDLRALDRLLLQK